MKFKNMDDSLKKILKFLKKRCYCRRGEGTFISKIPDDIGVCVYCHVKNYIEEEFKELLQSFAKEKK